MCTYLLKLALKTKNNKVNPTGRKHCRQKNYTWIDNLKNRHGSERYTFASELLMQNGVVQVRRYSERTEVIH